MTLEFSATGTDSLCVELAEILQLPADGKLQLKEAVSLLLQGCVLAADAARSARLGLGSAEPAIGDAEALQLRKALAAALQSVSAPPTFLTNSAAKQGTVVRCLHGSSIHD